jgi:hypothetical protein
MIIIMLLSLIVVGVVIVSTVIRDDNDTVQTSTENATDQPSLPVAQDPMDDRSQMLIDSRRLLTTASVRLLVAIKGLMTLTAPTALMNRCAKALKHLYDDMKSIKADLIQAGVHNTLWGMYPKRTENQMREAARAGALWALGLVCYYEQQVVCGITQKVADMRNVCEATISGMMAKVHTAWDDNAGEQGGKVEVSRGNNITGIWAIEWIMKVTDVETWVAAVAFLNDYRGRPTNTRNHYLPGGWYRRTDNPNYVDWESKLQFARKVLDAFREAAEATEESDFKVKCDTLGYTQH